MVSHELLFSNDMCGCDDTKVGIDGWFVVYHLTLRA